MSKDTTKTEVSSFQPEYAREDAGASCSNMIGPRLVPVANNCNPRAFPNENRCQQHFRNKIIIF